MPNIEWRFDKRPVSKDDIIQMESYFGVELPQPYIEVVLQHHGARPKPNVFDTTSRKGHVLKSFLPITRNEKGNIYEVHDWIKDNLSINMIPFASDQSGNYLCFCYVGPDQQPLVTLWSHESKEHPYEAVSRTFDGFLDSLYIPE